MASIQDVLSVLAEQFTIKSNVPFAFVGIKIAHDPTRGIMNLTQVTFIQNLLEKLNMTDCKSSSVPMQANIDLLPSNSCDPNIPYRQLIGSLHFLAWTTRPDISYAISKLSQYCTAYNEQHWIQAKSVLRYLKGTMNLG